MCAQAIAELARNSILVTGQNSFKIVLGNSSQKFMYQLLESNILS